MATLNKTFTIYWSDGHYDRGSLFFSKQVRKNFDYGCPELRGSIQSIAEKSFILFRFCLLFSE